MKSIALFFTFILSINVASSMFVGLSYKPVEKKCVEKIETISDKSNKTESHCCSADKKEKQNCCDDECDCTCCHQVKVMSSQINNSITQLEEQFAVNPVTQSSFTYKSPFDCEVSIQLLHPPQIS